MENRRAPQFTDSNDAERKHGIALPLPGSDAYAELPQFPTTKVLPFRRTIRRHELHQIIPLAETTIYEMERRGEFPRRFNLTPRCVVWDLDEVEAWIDARKQAAQAGSTAPASGPDVRLRRNRPVRKASSLA
ncbi:MAG: AlpA family phage regulatory protein [Rhodanobacter sp.]|nr:MAG: AlpA family phage regulatory protein [Rhodanobacter sp.]